MELEIEIENNEHLIAQREKGIEEIEQTIVEINELFRDLATMVHDQGFMLGMWIKWIYVFVKVASLMFGNA